MAPPMQTLVGAKATRANSHGVLGTAPAPHGDPTDLADSRPPTPMWGRTPQTFQTPLNPPWSRTPQLPRSCHALQTPLVWGQPEPGQGSALGCKCRGGHTNMQGDTLL